MIGRPIAAAMTASVTCAALLSVPAAAPAAAGRPAPHVHGHVPGFAAVRPTPPSGPVARPLKSQPGSVPKARARKPRPGKAAVTADQVGVRALVIAVDGDDFGLPTWRATLDRVGAAYDVLHSRTTPLTDAALVEPDGTGRYNAILLTDSMQLYPADGGWVSGFDADEWNRLWAYERDRAVRQATLYTSYGSWPEDHCLTGASEGGVGDTPLPASLTPAGAAVFDHLQPTAVVPITQSYVYRTRVAAGCAAEPVLVSGDDVLGVLTTATDGRERLALTFSFNQYLPQATLLPYGLFRWASRGLHFGEQRHYLNVDVDDWFNASDHLYPDGTLETDPGFQMSAHDAYNARQQQLALRAEHPLIGDFTFGMAYNGADADLTADATCSPDGDITQLTATSRCLANEFRWINHTVSHPELNFTDYATSRAEIENNLAIATTLGLPVPTTVVKTGEYSGLGVYNDDPDDDVTPPTDHGLGASNPNLLAAARDLGVRYLHGNMSFPSHVPSCFNCGITHPMEPSVTVVPDWPTNIAYHTTTPAEETYFYNSFYGPNGRFPYWPQDLTYEQLLDYETDVALDHVATGSLYAHTFHIANLRDYGEGRTLLTDWLDEVFTKYRGSYAVPLLNPDWPALGALADGRTAHFAGLAAGMRAVYDRTAGTVTVSATEAGTATVSGATGAGSTTYGNEVSAAITVPAGGAVTFTPALRS